MKLFHKDKTIQFPQSIPLDDSHQPIIEMKKVVKRFKTEAGIFTALNGIDMNFYHGEFIGVTGKSGSGKSTLANMITGIDHPTSGEVVINGVDIHKLNESQMARWRGKNLGIVFQFYQLLPMLTLLENIMLPMDFGEMYDPTEREKRATDLLQLVGLEKYATKMPAAISGGQQQTAAIARALANDPPLIIADEPTGNLDSRTAAHVFEIFERLAQQGKTIVMVTHDPALAKRTSRQIVISDGEIIDEGVVKALPHLSHPQMLKVTHQLNHQNYEPGEIILHQNQINDSFSIIESGQVDVIVTGKHGNRVVTKLRAGDYFGEIEVLERSKTIAEVRAGGGKPVEIQSLKREDLQAILSESSKMKETLKQIVQVRRKENENAARSEESLNIKDDRIAQTSLA